MEPQLTAEEERLMRWLEEDQDVLGHADFAADVPAEWMQEREAAHALGEMMRSHFPTELQPPGEFNRGIASRLSRD